MEQFDVIVIGSGTAGYNVARECRQRDLSVAVVERGTPGGTCALAGCQPKKFFVVQGELAHVAHDLAGKGVATPPVLDWPAAAAFKREFTDAVPGGTERFFERIGAEMVVGEARLEGPGTVRVGGRVLGAPSVVLATGAAPRPLPIPGGDLAVDSAAFLDLAELPARVILVGGGYIACEFAHVAAAYGAEVTLVNRSGRLLRGFDADLAREAEAGLRAAGVAVHLEQEPSGLERTAAGLRLECVGGGSFAADLVVGAVGRRPNLTGLGLETLGVTPDTRGLPVDERMAVQGAPAGLYAVGDCAATAQLAPVADREAIIAARAIAGEDTAMDYRVVPSVVFTQPPLATVGLTDGEADSRGIAHEVKRGDMTRWANQRRLGAKQGAYKLVVGEDGALLGAHVYGHGAADMINLFALAMHARVPAAELAELMWAYPSLSSDIKYMP